MQTPIITDETLSQMSLMRLTSYTLSLLAEALPHITNVETAEANAQASAAAAATSATAAETSADAASTSAAAAAGSEVTVETSVNAGVARINEAVTTGVTRINAAVTTVLNTEV